MAPFGVQPFGLGPFFPELYCIPLTYFSTLRSMRTLVPFGYVPEKVAASDGFSIVLTGPNHVRDRLANIR